jgi:thymidylate synthase
VTARTLHYGDGSTAYIGVTKEILTHGTTSAPRSLATRELVNTAVVIADASQAVPVDCRRNINERIGATEYAQLLAGVSSLTQLDLASNGRFSQFTDNGRLRGAYGPRVYHQLPWAMRKLEQDPDSRQSVVTIWKGFEARDAWRDTPCTVSLQFRRSNSKLNLAVMMRSSDAWLGIPYDWWMFSRLQMTMAWALGIAPGTFTFFAGSLHLYDQNAEQAKNLARSGAEGIERLQPPAMHGSEAEPQNASVRVKVAQDMALRVITGETIIDDIDINAQWYRNVLPQINEKVCGECRYMAPDAEIVASFGLESVYACRECHATP